MSDKLKRQQGLSLVELMVTMVISLFLSAGLYSMFTMSATNVITTSQFNQLQENGRIALAFMERDISQLGFMADMTGTDFIVGSNTQIDAVAIPAVNDCVGGGVNNASLPNNYPAHFRQIWGYEQGVSTESFSCLTSVSASTDVLQIKRLVGPSVEPNDANRYYIGTTANEAVLFSGNQTTPVINNARFWEYQHHIYYIQEDSGIPVLRRRVLRTGGMKTSGSYEQLVEGIENIRILYGFDSDADGTADSFMPVQNITSLMWDGSLAQSLVALRVFILVRSIDEDSSFTNESSYQLGDKKIAATNDHYRRKVVSSTIVLENAVLISN